MSRFYKITFLVFLGLSWFPLFPTLSCPPESSSDADSLYAPVRRVGLTRRMEQEFENGISYQAVVPTPQEKVPCAYGSHNTTVLIFPDGSSHTYRCTMYSRPNEAMTYVYSKSHEQASLDSPNDRDEIYTSRDTLLSHGTHGQFSFTRALYRIPQKIRGAKRAAAKALFCCFTHPSEETWDSEAPPSSYGPNGIQLHEEEAPTHFTRTPALYPQQPQSVNGNTLNPNYAYIILGRSEGGEQTLTHIPVPQEEDPKYRNAYTTLLAPIATHQTSWV